MSFIRDTTISYLGSGADPICLLYTCRYCRYHTCTCNDYLVLNAKSKRLQASLLAKLPRTAWKVVYSTYDSTRWLFFVPDKFFALFWSNILVDKGRRLKSTSEQSCTLNETLLTGCFGSWKTGLGQFSKQWLVCNYFCLSKGPITLPLNKRRIRIFLSQLRNACSTWSTDVNAGFERC